MAYQDSTTIRTTKCSFLVEKSGRCAACEGYRKTLYSTLSRLTSKPDSVSPTDPSSSVNLRYLSTPQKIVRFRRLHLKFKQTLGQLERLQEKLARHVEERSTAVDESLHQDLLGLVEDLTPQVIKNC